MAKYLNIACGSAFFDNEDWENVDYSSDHASVRRANLLHDLHNREPKYEALYCSHFLEHVPRDNVIGFLTMCRDLMTPESVLRIVVPDAEALAQEYLERRQAGEHEKADYAFTLFLDQCVRRRPGGDILPLIKAARSGEKPELASYVDEMSGVEAGNLSGKTKWQRLKTNPKLAYTALERVYIRLVSLLLPSAFRALNVSFTGVGEKHLWLYDYHMVASVLQAVGFTRISRCEEGVSTRGDDLFLPLEKIDGKSRKGAPQLFVEARL